MGFIDRAVEACARAMERGDVSGRHVRDVLRCERVDVGPFVRFLDAEEPMVRTMAARIVGEKGSSTKELLDAALKEKDTVVLMEMLGQLALHPEAVEAMAGLLNSYNLMIRDAAVDMFRRSGRADCLFPMLFDNDDMVVERTKRYLNEQTRKDGEVVGP